MDSELKLVFSAEWYQSEASLMREFVLNFYPKDNSIELIETKPRKVFLRRIPVDTVCAKDLFIGARIFVFGRKIHIVDYGNLETKVELGNKLQRGFLLVPGTLVNTKLDEVFRKISSLNLYLNSCFMIQISSDDLVKVDLMEDEKITSIKSNLLNDPSVVFELTGKSIDKKIQDIQESFPTVFGSVSETFLNHFFQPHTSGKQLLPRHQQSVLCLIKPHIVHGNQTGDLLSTILRKDFGIANLRLCHLDRDQCDEFLRVYAGVLPEFIQISIHLASGPLLALELVSKEPVEDIHSKFRNLCGPYDSEIAKQIRPHTLRAEFGVNKILNAVHCTDLKEDEGSELNFFFN